MNLIKRLFRKKENKKQCVLHVVRTRLLCLDKYTIWCDLTIGSEYQLVSQDEIDYTVINDAGEKCKYGKHLFKII